MSELRLRSPRELGSGPGSITSSSAAECVDHLARMWPSDALTLSVSHQGSDSVKSNEVSWFESQAFPWTGEIGPCDWRPHQNQMKRESRLLWSEQGAKRCWGGRSEALHPRIPPAGPSPGLPGNKFLFPCFPSPLPPLSFPPHSLKHLLSDCFVSGTLLGPGKKKKKMSQTQGQPWGSHLIQISIHDCSATARPRQALPVDHSTLSLGAWAQP